MSEKKIKISSAKGRPMLHWVGKKPLDFIKSFPAQLVEIFDSTGKGKQIENPAFEDLKDNWQNLLFHGDNKEVMGYLLANGFRGKVDLIYIDPPFNTGVDYIRKVQLRGADKARVQGEDYSPQEQIMYLNNFADDSFLQFMYERLQLLKELLCETGSIFVRFDYHFGHYIKVIMDEVFGKGNFRNEIIVNRIFKNIMESQDVLSFPTATDSIFFYSKSEKFILKEFKIMADKKRGAFWRHMGDSAGQGSSKIFFGKSLSPPYGNHWKFSQEKIDVLIKDSKLRLKCLECRYIHNRGRWNSCPNCKKDNPKPEYYVEESDKKILTSNWCNIPGYTANGTGYPTENSEKLLERIILTSSKIEDLILDCFIGSGTTQAVAQKLNRKWIGCDINKGAIQTTAKRLQKIIQEQSKDDNKNGKQKIINGNTEKPCLSFAHYKVNDYDLQLLRTEAIELAVQHVGIQRTKTDGFFDGKLGQNLVKIIDFNHPLTLLDLELIQDELKKRPDENRNITIVCLGKELAVDSFIEEHNKKHPVNKIEVIELRTDKKYGKFLIHKPSQAKVAIKRKGEKAIVEIEDFISPSIIERLNDEEKLVKVKISDFRSMIDIVLIDNNYDGKTFNITYSDVPEKKKDLVQGKYEIEAPKEKARVAVKIIDMLGEEALITKEI